MRFRRTRNVGLRFLIRVRSPRRERFPGIRLSLLSPDFDESWQARVDGPVYRRTPILRRFRWYRRLRVWWLRRQIAK